MKQKLLSFIVALLCSMGTWAQTDVTSTYLTADFTSPTGWTNYSGGGSEHSEGFGLIGTLSLNGKASTTDATHLSTEYCCGFSARWNGRYTYYQQTSAELSEGYYELTYDVQDVNSSSTKYNMDNYFYVQVGETKYNDSATEWMNAGASGWTTHTISFGLAEASTIILSMGYGNKENKGTGDCPAIYVSHLKLTKYADLDTYLRIKNNLTGAAYNNSIVTSFVTNGTFDSNANGWTSTGGFQNKGTASNQTGDFTGNFWENWNGSAKVNKMYQTINNVPNGTYRLNIAAFVNTLASPNVSQYVFANSDNVYLSTGSPTAYEVWTVVTTNQIEIGLEQTTATANWMGIDNISLTYYGAGDVINDAKNASHKMDWETALAAAIAARDNSDYDNVVGTERTALNTEIAKAEPSTADDYDAATIAFNTATYNFTSAKGNYDALVAEIAHAKTLGVASATADGYAATSSSTAATALASIQTLNELEYTAVTTIYTTDGSALFIDSWTNTNFGSTSGQHWKDGSTSYTDKWNSSAMDCSISKIVSLPEGCYAFYAAGRGQQNSPSTLTLKVAISGGETLTQAYNMKGDTGKGIDTNGAANFGSGTFVNDGTGRGWEWRYIAFNLDEETEVTLSVEGHIDNSWIGTCDAKLLTYNNIAVSRSLYETNKAAAEAARDNSDYNNVTGSERTALVAAIGADVTETYAGYNTAAENLALATSNFTGAKASYDGLVAINATIASVGTLEYASSLKKPSSTVSATSASDAATKTASQTTALRAYYESNAMAEGVVGAEDKTSLISDPNMDVTYNSTAHTFGAWQVFNQVDGTISLKTESDQPLTDGDGNKYKYADIWKSDNNGGIKQTLSNLPAGKYLLTVAGRGQNVASATFVLFAGTNNVPIPLRDNTGEVFGNGWNDVSLMFYVSETSDVEIGVVSGNGKTMWWGATRFRLVKLPTPAVTPSDSEAWTPENQYADFTLNRTFGTNWSTLVLPFDVDNATLKDKFGDDVRISEFSADDKSGVKFTPMAEPAITANKPVLIKANTEETSFEFNGVTIKAATPTISDNGVNFVGNYDGDITLPAGSYYVKSNTLKRATEDGKQKLLNFRAYFTVNPDSPVKAFIFEGALDLDDTTDAINAIESAQTKDATIYNLAGQRVSKAQKGLYIVNGRKVVIK